MLLTAIANSIYTACFGPILYVLVYLMNKKEGIKLCESELKVMELLWEEGELRAGEIVPILSARVGWNRNTTYTIIKKCVEKGAIRRIEPKFVCQPLVTKEQTQVYEINALAERLFDGSLEKLRKVVEEIM